MLATAWGTGEDERVDFLVARGVPFVALGRIRSGTGFAWLDLDIAAMARDAVGAPKP